MNRPVARCHALSPEWISRIARHRIINCAVRLLRGKAYGAAAALHPVFPTRQRP